MSAVRSMPVTVSIDLPGLLSGVMSCFVIIPSISTSTEPLTVTAMITRVRGSKYPDTSICCTGDCLPSVNFI